MRPVVILSLLVAGAARAQTPAPTTPLTLSQLVARARANDHRVKAAGADLRYLQSKYEEAKWAWFPHITSYVLVGGPTPEARNDGLGGPPTTHASLMYDLDFGQPGVMFRAGADAVLPLYTFGKFDALEEAGRRGVQAGEALHLTAADEAELQVTQAYLGYCLAQAGKVVLKDTVGRLDDAGKTLTRLREAQSEQVSQTDLYKLDFYRHQAEAQRAAAEAGEAYALEAVRLLIGAGPAETVTLEPTPLDPPEGALLPVDAYLATAKDHRPELRAIEAGIAARQQLVVLRERMYYPDFGLAGFAHWAWTTNTTRQRSPFAYDPYNDLSAGVALVGQYVFDFPQKAVALEQARAELEKLEHQRDLLTAGVRLEIEKLWADANGAAKRGREQAAAEKSARKWAVAAFTAFDLGTSDTRELVDSFSALAMASSQKNQAWFDLRQGLAQLARATGAHVELAPPPAAVFLPAKLLPAAP
jgi:outer membrane protein TolC